MGGTIQEPRAKLLRLSRAGPGAVATTPSPAAGYWFPCPCPELASGVEGSPQSCRYPQGGHCGCGKLAIDSGDVGESLGFDPES